MEFANGSVWDQAMIQTVVDRATNNRFPTINSYLPTLQAKARTALNYTVAANTITDPDVFDSVTYSIKMANRAAVPAWLTFDPVTRTMSGTPKVGNVGTLQFILWGTDKLTLNNGYLGNQYHVEQFKTTNGKMLLDSQVQNLVQAMAAFAPPAAGQTTLSASYQTTLNPMIAAN